MDIVTLAIVSIIAQLFGAFIAYHIGVRFERIKWNDLIKLGIINAPKNGPSLMTAAGTLQGKEQHAAFDRVTGK